jgi:hypothetical protein
MVKTKRSNCKFIHDLNLMRVFLFSEHTLFAFLYGSALCHSFSNPMTKFVPKENTEVDSFFKTYSFLRGNWSA